MEDLVNGREFSHPEAMAWITIIGEDAAAGLLARLYREARARAGKVFNVLKIQSQQPRTLLLSTKLFAEVMMGAGPLSRAQRELIATVVSAANGCAY